MKTKEPMDTKTRQGMMHELYSPPPTVAASLLH